MLIAQIGKSVGLKGDLKLKLFTDFPEQFRKGVSFKTSRGVLEIERFNPERDIIKFKGFDEPETARQLTNVKLYSSEEQTRELCSLKDDEYFWFDIIGCEIVDDSVVLGRVDEIQRLEGMDYLTVSTVDELKAQGLPKSFLIPYIDRYIDYVDITGKKIFTKDAILLLEAS